MTLSSLLVRSSWRSQVIETKAGQSGCQCKSPAGFRPRGFGFGLGPGRGHGCFGSGGGVFAWPEAP